MSVYHSKRKRSIVDWLMLILVVIVASFIIRLSFINTTKLATGLSIGPKVLAGLIELMFAALLFIRGRQRATKRNVPMFIHLLYYSSFVFVTWSNVTGLYQENHINGPIVGIAISGAMMGLESTLVWLWTRSHEPHKKSLWELKREAKREAKEEEIMQEIDYLRWVARKASPKLIKRARRDEEKRKRIEADGLPEYFRQQPEPTPELIAEPIVQQGNTTEIVPMRAIGFHAEPNTEHPTPNTPNKHLTKTEQAEQYVISLIEQNKEFTVRGVASKIGCSVSTAQTAINRAKGKMSGAE